MPGGPAVRGLLHDDLIRAAARVGDHVAVRCGDDALATYERLHDVVVVDDIPRLASGKVLRRTLRDEVAPRLSTTGAR